MIRDLWNGNVKLVVVYWGYLVTVGIAYRIMDAIITANMPSITSAPLGYLLLYIFVAFPFVYFPFIYVAIWRSADKYTKSKGWSSLAKIAVCISAFFLLINGVSLVHELFSTESLSREEINKQIVDINKSLPKMVDDVTELSNVSFENNVLSYNYRIIVSNSFQIDSGIFNNLNKKIITEVCNKSFFTPILIGGGSVMYIYKDNQGNIVNKLVVDGTSCQH